LTPLTSPIIIKVSCVFHLFNARKLNVVFSIVNQAKPTDCNPLGLPMVLSMKFIELSGKSLMRVLDDDELHPNELARMGVTDESVVRINRQGDIELRRADRWDVIGGLLGEFESRIKRETGLDWL
jgi:hypothetical protein